MSFRLEMLQVARLAPKVLGESTDLVADFLRSRLLDEGGFMNREGKPDLYYTVFGIEGLLALQQDLPSDSIAGWLHQFGDGARLDFVHLCCLARCWAALHPKAMTEDARRAMALRVEAYRAGTGYHPAAGRERGSAYGCLLACAAYEDLALPLPDPEGLKACMDGLLCEDGGWTNETLLKLANAPGTAAALSLYRRMNWPLPPASISWLLGCLHPGGGFLAFPKAPIPDLLSTAVALHGLAGTGAELVAQVKEPCLDFVDSLWSAEGGFHGNWTDHTLDCEYTYYGLLALGHLSL